MAVADLLAGTVEVMRIWNHSGSTMTGWTTE
jgi:hypothetical protein